MQEKIALLDARLLEDRNKLKIIDHWLNVLNWSNGWHYDLDIIWVIQAIEELKLPVGSTIIDAGAGLGITQFILAAAGYNVISLDFVDRRIPKFTKKIFAIEKVNHDLGAYKHEYMEFMSYGQKHGSKERKRSPVSLIKKAVNPGRFNLNLYIARCLLKNFLNFSYLLEKLKDHGSFGKIVFVRGTFNDMPLGDCIGDALISISAFEHNSYEDMPGSINEFMRVIKKGAPMFITTSAAESKDWYFEPPKAWNFSRDTLSSWFNIPQDKIIFDYNSAFEGIRNSKILRKRIPASYKLSGENGLPYGKLMEMRYIPVGIIKIKE